MNSVEPSSLSAGLSEEQLDGLWCGDNLRVLNQCVDLMKGEVIEFASLSAARLIRYWGGVENTFHPYRYIRKEDVELSENPGPRTLSRREFESLKKGDRCLVVRPPRLGFCRPVIGQVITVNFTGSPSIPVVKYGLNDIDFVEASCLHQLGLNDLDPDRPLTRPEWAVLSKGDKLRALPGAFGGHGDMADGKICVGFTGISGSGQLLVTDSWNRLWAAEDLTPDRIAHLKTAHEPVAPYALTPAEWVETKPGDTLVLLSEHAGLAAGRAVIARELMVHPRFGKDFRFVMIKEGSLWIPVPIKALAKAGSPRLPVPLPAPGTKEKSVLRSDFDSFLGSLASWQFLAAMAWSIGLSLILQLNSPPLTSPQASPGNYSLLMDYSAKKGEAIRLNRSLREEFNAYRAGKPNHLSEAMIGSSRARREAEETRGRLLLELRQRTPRDTRRADRILDVIDAGLLSSPDR